VLRQELAEAAEIIDGALPAVGRDRPGEFVVLVERGGHGPDQRFLEGRSLEREGLSCARAVNGGGRGEPALKQQRRDEQEQQEEIRRLPRSNSVIASRVRPDHSSPHDDVLKPEDHSFTRAVQARPEPIARRFDRAHSP